MNVTQMAEIATAAPLAANPKADMSKLGQHTRAIANRCEREQLAEKVNSMYAELEVTVRVAPKG